MRAATATRRSTAGRRASPPGPPAAQVDDARRASPTTGPRRARRDVYCYFDDDVKVHAPCDAARLAARLGLPSGLSADGRFVPPPGLAPPRRRAPGFAARRSAGT